MIRIINSANATLHREALEQQFANRHEVFVKEMGWTAFEVAPNVEKDDFDDEHTIYAVSIDTDNEVIGGIRFYPTTRPHMLSKSFPHLVDGQIIAKPDVYEVSRSHLLPKHRGAAQYLELMVAIQEVGLYLGATGMTSLIRTLRLPIILETGLAVTPIGEPYLIDGVSSLAVFYEINERFLVRMNKRRGTNQSVFERSPAMRLQA